MQASLPVEFAAPWVAMQVKLGGGPSLTVEQLALLQRLNALPFEVRQRVVRQAERQKRPITASEVEQAHALVLLEVKAATAATEFAKAARAEHESLKAAREAERQAARAALEAARAERESVKAARAAARPALEAARESKAEARRRRQLEMAERQVARKQAGGKLIGRPRKYFSEEERKAGELARRRKAYYARKARLEALEATNPAKALALREAKNAKARQANRRHRAKAKADPAKVAERQAADRAWRAKNPERVREYARRWRLANPEKSQESKRRWRARNPEKAKLIEKARWQVRKAKKQAESQQSQQ